MAVVIKYRPMVFPPTLPSILGSESELDPQTSDTNTSGTTSIFNRLMNIWPTTRKRPSVSQYCDQSGFPAQLSNSPTIAPATIAIRILILRLIFLAVLIA